ncbi:hypothetical protein MMC18_009623 [Xylographa bjoerkii]|nr:hypothetical protein [Xylographa bjoerkii]
MAGTKRSRQPPVGRSKLAGATETSTGNQECTPAPRRTPRRAAKDKKPVTDQVDLGSDEPEPKRRASSRRPRLSALGEGDDEKELLDGKEDHESDEDYELLTEANLLASRTQGSGDYLDDAEAYVEEGLDLGSDEFSDDGDDEDQEIASDTKEDIAQDHPDIQRFRDRLMFILSRLIANVLSMSFEDWWATSDGKSVFSTEIKGQTPVQKRPPILYPFWYFLCNVDIDFLIEVYMSMIPGRLQPILGRKAFGLVDLQELPLVGKSNSWA